MTDAELIHPLYLDVQMMFSFLAYLQGGVALGGEGVWTATGSVESTGKASGKLKLPFLAPLLGAELSADGSRAAKSSDSAEYKAAWHHTAASLFNALYAYLHEDGKVFELSSPNDLVDLKHGSLVELEGQYLGNPFEAVLALAAQFASYRDAGLTEGPGQPPKDPKRSGNPAARSNASRPRSQEEIEAQAEKEAQDFGLRISLQMRDELARSPVRDVLLVTGEGLRVVLTAAAEYFSDETREFLRSGQFKVIGKVTRILTESDELNLTRRTIIGAAGPEVARQIVQGFSTLPNIYSADPDPIISSPAVQILPMSIFI